MSDQRPDISIVTAKQTASIGETMSMDGLVERRRHLLHIVIQEYIETAQPVGSNNIAKQHTEIVKNMLSKYENWFDQAIKDRGPDWPQRIYLGTSFQKNVQLSRFDWGGPGVYGNQPNKYGYWEVFSTAARYRITLRFQKATTSGLACFKYQGLEKNIPVSEGKTSVIFDDIELPAGKGRLQAFLKFDSKEMGAQFLDVERIN